MNEENTKPVAVVDDAADLQGKIESLEGENLELKRSSQLAQARNAAVTALGRLGAVSPALLFEAAELELQFDETGAVVNLEAQLATLQRKYPEQFAVVPRIPTTIDAGAGRSAPPQLSKEALSRMTPAEIAELDWNDVRRVLAS